MNINIDNYYWFFSAAAQAIAAFVALLLAGIALAYSMMDRLVESDPTLWEVNLGIKQRYHKWLAILAIVTGFAIILSLASTFLNPHPGWLRASLMLMAVECDVAAIFGGILFVIKIIDPNRYTREAKHELKEMERGRLAQKPVSVYFNEFIKFEQSIRDYLKKHELYVPSLGAPKMTFSFREMVNALFQNEHISRALRDEMLEVNKFRNLLFHGHVTDVTDEALSKLIEVRNKWKNIAQQLNGDDSE
jgi:hypothetical protein